MGEKPKGWPSHGHAVNARNDVAEKQLAILDEVDELIELVEAGEVTRLAVTLAASRIRGAAAASLLLMVQQGAPVRPERLR